MTNGKPFLEVFASALHEDYRFPILEVFAFLYALGTFMFASFGIPFYALARSNEAIAFHLTESLLGIPLFVFVILIFKNIAFGLGNDLEKGTIQTYLLYPLNRRGLLTAKLLSALGVAVTLFLTIQISTLYLLAPDIVSPHLSIVLLTYAAKLSYPLLITGIILLVTLILKRGGLALVTGIILYFAGSIILMLVTSVASATDSFFPLQIASVIFPDVALLRYCSTYIPSPELWTPTFPEVLVFIGASYVIVAFFFVLGYLLFDRKLDL